MAAPTKLRPSADGTQALCAVCQDEGCEWCPRVDDDVREALEALGRDARHDRLTWLLREARSELDDARRMLARPLVPEVRARWERRAYICGLMLDTLRSELEELGA